MKGTLKLKKPILINNKEVTELIYDTDEITIALMAEAEAHKLKLVGPEVVSVAETDNCYHLFLGMAACVAAMDKVIFEDLNNKLNAIDVPPNSTVAK